jgi:hypothetical protein
MEEKGRDEGAEVTKGIKKVDQLHLVPVSAILDLTSTPPYIFMER